MKLQNLRNLLIMIILINLTSISNGQIKKEYAGVWTLKLQLLRMASISELMR